MNHPTRRQWLGQAALGISALSASRVLGANDRIRVASIGLGGQGSGNASRMAKVPGVEIVWLCDPDKAALDRAKARYPQAQVTQDFRRALEDDSVNVVVVSTGNHWHVLASIWAMQAGKDVYVEKPVSQNIWEGRQLVRAARHFNRIVQGGTQQRSDPFHDELKAFLDRGDLGAMRYVRCNHYSMRATIGKRSTPLTPPAGLDYQFWLGPAQDQPIYRDKLHYDWHWDWNTGNGELGNWGPHILDDLRNIVWRDRLTLPKRVLACGGRLGWNDAGQTPNTHSIYYDTGDVPVVMDVHNLPRKKGMKAGDVYWRRRSNAFLIIECENGYYAGGRGGGTAYDAQGKVLAKFKGNGGATHAANFIDAVRSRKRSDLKAEVEQIHYSSAWCHLGNLSWQLGQDGDLDRSREAVASFKPWAEVFEDLPAHLAANEITLGKGDWKVGAMLELDVAVETLAPASATEQAQGLWRRRDRKGFEVPEKF